VFLERLFNPVHKIFVRHRLLENFPHTRLLQPKRRLLGVGGEYNCGYSNVRLAQALEKFQPVLFPEYANSAEAAIGLFREVLEKFGRGAAKLDAL
jgi:hypothetical protein